MHGNPERGRAATGQRHQHEQPPSDSGGGGHVCKPNDRIKPIDSSFESTTGSHLEACGNGIKNSLSLCRGSGGGGGGGRDEGSRFYGRSTTAVRP